MLGARPGGADQPRHPPGPEKSAQLVNRDAMHGQIAQLQVGEGAEFEALTDYRQGMDRRSIDWKTSARHTMLIGKEYRTERNNNIVMALDAGRAMCEPLNGVPRIDRAVSAALLTAFVALKDGDRVGFFAFDSKPRASSNPISGPRAFPMLQRVAAGIDYSAHETNYTLAMATLAGSLSRRSLIVVFTEFPDTISAELMLNAVGTLLQRHLVLFVVLRDEELEQFTGAEPGEPEDVSRAVMAAGAAARAAAGADPAAAPGRARDRGGGELGGAGSGQRLSRFEAEEFAVRVEGTGIGGYSTSFQRKLGSMNTEVADGSLTPCSWILTFVRMTAGGMNL